MFEETTPTTSSDKPYQGMQPPAKLPAEPLPEKVFDTVIYLLGIEVTDLRNPEDRQ